MREKVVKVQKDAAKIGTLAAARRDVALTKLREEIAVLGRSSIELRLRNANGLPLTLI